jgi:hypothetical protein
MFVRGHIAQQLTSRQARKTPSIFPVFPGSYQKWSAAFLADKELDLSVDAAFNK